MTRGTLLSLCFAALVTTSAIALSPAAEGASGGASVDVPTPAPAGGTYDPMRSFAPLVDAVAPAVVKIEVRTRITTPGLPAMFRDFFGERLDMGPPRTRRGEGSGFVISSDGKLLTNAHVVEDADEIVAVFQDGTEIPAVVLGR